VGGLFSARPGPLFLSSGDHRISFSASHTSGLFFEQFFSTDVTPGRDGFFKRRFFFSLDGAKNPFPRRRGFFLFDRPRPFRSSASPPSQRKTSIYKRQRFFFTANRQAFPPQRPSFFVLVRLEGDVVTFFKRPKAAPFFPCLCVDLAFFPGPGNRVPGILGELSAKRLAGFLREEFHSIIRCCCSFSRE